MERFAFSVLGPAVRFDKFRLSALPSDMYRVAHGSERRLEHGPRSFKAEQQADEREVISWPCPNEDGD